MKLKGDNIIIETMKEPTEADIRFLKFILNLTDKAYGDPSYQLNTLSILTTGRSFIEVMEGRDEKFIINFITLIRDILQNDFNMSSEEIDKRIPALSELTIEQFLKNMGPKTELEEGEDEF